MSFAERVEIARNRRKGLVEDKEAALVLAAIVAYTVSSLAAFEGVFGDSLGHIGPALAVHLFLAAIVWRPWVIALPFLLALIGLAYNSPDPDGASSYAFVLVLYIPIGLALMTAGWAAGRAIELVSITVRWLPTLALLGSPVCLMLAAFVGQDPGDTYFSTDRDFFTALSGFFLGSAAVPMMVQAREGQLRRA